MFRNHRSGPALELDDDGEGSGKPFSRLRKDFIGRMHLQAPMPRSTAELLEGVDFLGARKCLEWVCLG